MSVTCPLLLCLLSALVEVHSQTVPYVSFMGTNLHNHSYVDLTLVGNALNGSDSVQCRTDLSKCCNAAQGADRGDWYAPGSQDRLPFPGDPDDIYEQREAQRVDLRRRKNGTTSGIYCCTIETNAVHSDNSSDTTTRETVYAGLYASGGECAHGEEQSIDSVPTVLQVMSPYQVVWHSVRTLTSMERALNSPSPVPPLVALLPLSLGPETLRQSQEG